jgi:aspartyl-tRNA(Asn)/glutamyl-tRNA(Gln) amidotransferase subunit A
MMHSCDIPYLSIHQLAGLYRSKKLSPVQVTEIAFERIDQWDDKLNAFNTVLKAEALEQSRKAEQDFAAEIDRGLFQGVPFSLKDIFDTAGIRTTASSDHWSERRPKHTATSAKRLLDPGGILIGKCNLLEFAYGIVHPAFGQTNNPWDFNRTSGGSSGGSAASIAAGIGYASLGTDTGGSVRIPASYCGIVGFKPTYGRISRHGVFPLSWSLDHVGILTRCVEDAAVVMNLIAGYDPNDQTSIRDEFHCDLSDLKNSLKGLKFGILAQHVDHADIKEDVQNLFLSAAKEFEKLGATLQQVRIPSLDQADIAMLLAILPEASVIHKQLLAENPQKYAEMTRQQLETGVFIPATRYIEAQQFRTRLLREYLDVFQDVDLLISPTVAFEAPAEDPVVAAGEGSVEARRTGPYNLTGLPAVSIPCGFGDAGMPVGIQIVGPPMQDALVLQAAYQYEQSSGWYKFHPEL